MVKSVQDQSGKSQDRRPAPPPEAEAAAKPAGKPAAIVRGVAAMINSAVKSIKVGLGSSMAGKARSDWTAGIDVDLEKLPPSAVAHLLKLGLEKHFASCAAGKVKNEDGSSRNRTEAEALAVAEKKLAELYQGKVSARKATKSDPVTKKAVEIATAEIKAIFAQQDQKITAKQAKELVTKAMEEQPKMRERWLAAAEDALEKSRKAIAEIDLSALDLTAIGQA